MARAGALRASNSEGDRGGQPISGEGGGATGASTRAVSRASALRAPAPMPSSYGDSPHPVFADCDEDAAIASGIPRQTGQATVGDAIDVVSVSVWRRHRSLDLRVRSRQRKLAPDQSEAPRDAERVGVHGQYPTPEGVHHYTFSSLDTHSRKRGEVLLNEPIIGLPQTGEADAAEIGKQPPRDRP